MKKMLAALLAACLLGSLVGCAARADAAPVVEIPAEELGKAKFHSIDYAGDKRNYTLYIPEGIQPGAPLVFMLHGYADIASHFIELTGMNAVADAHGFAVVYPQGLPSDDGQFPYYHWNADFTYSDVDDVGYLAALAAHLQECYGFAADKTFAAGLSNGGFMCYTLALRAPGVFTAVASVAGTMSGLAWEERDAAEPIPLLQVHGKADVVIPINGSVFPEGGWGGAPKMDTVLEYWAGVNSLNAMEETTEGDILTRLYTAEGSDVQVQYTLIRGFGHDWPTRDNSGVDTSRLIWEFFSQYV